MSDWQYCTDCGKAERRPLTYCAYCGNLLELLQIQEDEPPEDTGTFHRSEVFDWSTIYKPKDNT